MKRSRPAVQNKLPVRVCFMIDDLTRAGVETQLVKLINKLDRSKIEPCLCLLARRSEFAASLLPEDCPSHWLGVTSMRRPSVVGHAWRLARFLRREKIDVLHVDLPGSTLFGIPVGWLARVPYLIRTRRDLGYWMNWKDRWAGRVYSHLVDLTITNCRVCQQSVIEVEGARPESVVILENDIDLAKFRDIPTLAAQKPAGRPRVVGMVANLRPVKAPEVFVEAARRVADRHDDVVFRIAGEGSLRGPLEQQIRDLGLSGRIELPGHVVDVPCFLSELDVAVLCSDSEGLANVLLEYMAAGRPVVATRVGGAEEVIDDGVNGFLVPAHDPAALAEAIERLLSDSDLAARLAAAARSRVEEEYDAPNIAQRFESLVFRMMGIPDAAQTFEATVTDGCRAGQVTVPRQVSYRGDPRDSTSARHSVEGVLPDQAPQASVGPSLAEGTKSTTGAAHAAFGHQEDCYRFVPDRLKRDTVDDDDPTELAS